MRVQYYQIYRIVGGYEHNKYAIKYNGKMYVLGGKTMKEVNRYGKYIQYRMKTSAISGYFKETKYVMKMEFY